MSTGKTLPDMDWIQNSVPVREVAEILGVQSGGGNMLYCWRPENHKHGDANPSVGIDHRRNKVKCFVCDGKQLSNLDLVIEIRGGSVRDAANWIAGTWPCPARVKQRVKKTEAGMVRWSDQGWQMVKGSAYELEYISDFQNASRLPNPWQQMWDSSSWMEVDAKYLKVLMVMCFLTPKVPVRGDVDQQVPEAALARRDRQDGAEAHITGIDGCSNVPEQWLLECGQRALAKASGGDRRTVRKAIEFGQSIGLLEVAPGRHSRYPSQWLS